MRIEQIIRQNAAIIILHRLAGLLSNVLTIPRHTRLISLHLANPGYQAIMLGQHPVDQFVLDKLLAIGFMGKITEIETLTKWLQIILVEPVSDGDSFHSHSFQVSPVAATILLQRIQGKNNSFPVGRIRHHLPRRGKWCCFQVIPKGNRWLASSSALYLENTSPTWPWF